MKKDTGGPAYPTNNWQKMVPQASGYHEGMTLRDYFAAKAMQGMFTNSTVESLAPAFISEWAYKYADAMLKAREE